MLPNYPRSANFCPSDGCCPGAPRFEVIITGVFNVIGLGAAVGLGMRFAIVLIVLPVSCVRCLWLTIMFENHAGRAEDASSATLRYLMDEMAFLTPLVTVFPLLLLNQLSE